jgi:hypothetical protein
MRGAFEGLHPFDRKCVGANARDSCAYRIKKVAQSLNVGLARCVMENSDPVSQSSCAETIFGCSDGGFIQQDVSSLKFFSFDLDSVAGVGDLCAQGREDLEVSVETPTSDSVTTGPREGDFPCACEKGAS